jgi:hypothetical protein
MPRYSTKSEDYHQQPSPLDTGKINEIIQQGKAAWKNFQELVDGLPLPQEMKHTLKLTAWTAINLKDAYWDLIAGACLDQTGWYSERLTPLLQKFQNLKIGGRVKRERTADRWKLIAEKLAPPFNWKPKEIFAFLKEHHPKLVKKVQNPENMMRAFRIASRRTTG